MRRPSIVLIAAWFGPLPGHFQLWLDSCGYSESFDWLVYADAPTDAYSPPPNVHLRPTSLARFAARLGEGAGVTPPPPPPYKLCDWRPLFWTLLRDAPKAYDFWGHCDLDLIFGRLDAFVTPERLARYDKLFTLGHLTIYRNGDLANQMYRRPHARLDWRDILADPRPRGFDEHCGVNLLWRASGAPMFEDESLVVDVDPAVARFTRLPPHRNHRRQIFYFDAGRVWRAGATQGGWRVEEFMYIHFQKRPMPHLPARGARRYVIAPGGFYDFPDGAGFDELAQTYDRAGSDWRERLHRLRARARLWRARWTAPARGGSGLAV